MAGARERERARRLNQVARADAALSRMILLDDRMNGTCPYGDQPYRNQCHLANRTLPLVIVHHVGMHRAGPGNRRQLRDGGARVRALRERESGEHYQKRQNGPDFHSYLTKFNKVPSTKGRGLRRRPAGRIWDARQAAEWGASSVRRDEPDRTETPTPARQIGRAHV